MKKNKFFILLLSLSIFVSLSAQDWQMKKARIMTPWSENINPQNVLPEYPRPQLVRSEWQNLNGLWDYTKVEKMTYNANQKFDTKILVPFTMESAISGIMDTNHADNKGKIFLYRRNFTIPENMKGKEIILHFGAVDWKCEVYVNGKKVGGHKGGFDPFSFNITKALNSSQNEIQVFVQDYQEFGGYPHGKQKINEKIIWYTPATGIWQTVWIEPVSKTHIEKLAINPDIDKKQINITVNAEKATATTKATIKIYDKGKLISTTKDVAVGENKAISISKMKLWSPESPFLYDFKVELTDNGTTVDVVDSYFGMRKISLGKVNNQPCMLLNNKPYFHYGVLDQGYWPDGIYTAPTDEALKFDLIKTKEFGMNMSRKHIKVEPARWYYHCDKLGVLVWQDIPNPGFGENGKIIGEDLDIRDNFHDEMVRIMKSLENYPSIVLWTVYNESWGQPNEAETRKSVDIARKTDPTRLISGASGWNDYECGDIKDTHWYPEPNMAANDENHRASVCGEYGGITLMMDGHRWIGGSKMQYTQVYSKEEFKNRFNDYVKRIEQLQANGLCAAVYTQITDVEDEENGLITYDRKVVKVDDNQLAQVRKAVERNYSFTSKSIVPIAYSKETAGTWKYNMTNTLLADNSWKDASFSDSNWKKGLGGFGNGMRHVIINTKWTDSNIYLRRWVNFENLKQNQAKDIKLQILYDEDCEVYINGVLAAELKGHSNRYMFVDISNAAKATIKVGKPNLIAVKCSQKEGDQYIDLGFYLENIAKK